MENLDAMDESELLGARDTFITLANYCTRKRRAMEFRVAGRIAAAQLYEQECQEIYDSLPDWARW